MLIKILLKKFGFDIELIEYKHSCQLVIYYKSRNRRNGTWLIFDYIDNFTWNGEYYVEDNDK